MTPPTRRSTAGDAANSTTGEHVLPEDKKHEGVEGEHENGVVNLERGGAITHYRLQHELSMRQPNADPPISNGGAKHTSHIYAAKCSRVGPLTRNSSSVKGGSELRTLYLTARNNGGSVAR